MDLLTPGLGIIAILFLVLFLIPMLVNSVLRNVEAGTIRLVSWLRGRTVIYRGPGKSMEIPLLTTGTTISSKVINVDLDITDQTADLDDQGAPRPIKVRVLASAIVSVGDSDQLIKTAANRFFSKPDNDQTNTLTDLLSSSARRAINLLTHDQLSPPRPRPKHSRRCNRPEPPWHPHSRHRWQRRRTTTIRSPSSSGRPAPGSSPTSV
jgi:flotillin